MITKRTKMINMKKKNVYARKSTNNIRKHEWNVFETTSISPTHILVWELERERIITESDYTKYVKLYEHLCWCCFFSRYEASSSIMSINMMHSFFSHPSCTKWISIELCSNVQMSKWENMYEKCVQCVHFCDCKSKIELNKFCLVKNLSK